MPKCHKIFSAFEHCGIYVHIFMGHSKTRKSTYVLYNLNKIIVHPLYLVSNYRNGILLYFPNAIVWLVAIYRFRINIKFLFYTQKSLNEKEFIATKPQFQHWWIHPIESKASITVESDSSMHYIWRFIRNLNNKLVQFQVYIRLKHRNTLH